MGDFIRPMIVNIIFVLLLTTNTPANTKLQTDNQSNDIPLREYFELLRKSEGINFVYSDKLVKDISISIDDTSNLLRTELKNLLIKHNLSYKSFKENTLVIFKLEEQKNKITYEKVLTAEEVTETDSAGMQIKPILLYKPIPPYPRQAVRKGIEGNVRIKFLIEKDGTISRSEVLATSGHTVLDSAAREYVYNLKYSPAERDGKPRKSWMSMLFRYMLSKQ